MTPNVPNGGRTASHAIARSRTLVREDGTKVQLGLEHQAKTWPSPTLRIHKGGGQAVTRTDGKSRLDMLDWAAEAWIPSPSLHQAPQTPDGLRSLNGRLTLYLRYRAMTDLRLRSEMKALLRMGARSRANGITLFRLRPKHFSAYVRPSFRRRLNSTFVEYLMRWPIGWTDFACSETGLILWRQLMRGYVLTLVTARIARQPQGELL